MIDRDLAHPWPAEVTQATARFKQGDLVEHPPFFYGGVTDYGVWGLTRAVEETSAATEVLQLDPVDGEPAYGLITTQTCDLAPRHVVDWFDEWWADAQTPTEMAGLALLGNKYSTLEGISAREYVNSIPLDFRYLSPED